MAVMALAVALVVTPGLPSSGGATGPEPATASSVHGDDHMYLGPGPVHFPAGHVVPVSGIGVISVVDVVFDPVGGYVCQAPAGAGPCTPSHPALAQGRVFCTGITLYEDGWWDPALDLWVYVGAPFDTLGAGFGVSCESPRPATTGYVYHWGPTGQ